MPKIAKALRRERKHHRRRYGMTLVGDSTRRVMRALAAREQASDVEESVTMDTRAEKQPRQRRHT